MCYIYRIYFNKKDNYIGSTINFKKRKWQHLNDLRKNKHCNSYLQNIYNKYGEDLFRFEIIEKCNIQDRNKVEYEYINNSIYNCPYNLAININVPVNQYRKGRLNKKDIEDIFFMANNFNNIKDISKKYGLNPDFIRLILKKKYYKLYSKDLSIDYKNYQKENAKKLQKLLHKKKYYLYDSNKNFLGIFNNFSEVAEKYNICAKSLCSSLNKYCPTGFYIKNNYVDSSEIREKQKLMNTKLKTSLLHIFNLNYDFLETINGYTDASKKLNITRASINSSSRFLNKCSKKYYIIRDFDLDKFENKYNIKIKEKIKCNK